MNNKGDINLSINAIVVLILAITMLGLGLSFMRVMFQDIAPKRGLCTQKYTIDCPLQKETETLYKIEYLRHGVSECCYFIEFDDGYILKNCRLEKNKSNFTVLKNVTEGECLSGYFEESPKWEEE